MFVSRTFTRDNNLSPKVSLIIKGEDSQHKGLIIDLVEDERITEDLIDDIDIFGPEISLDDDSRLELLPTHTIKKSKKLKNIKKIKVKRKEESEESEEEITRSYDDTNKIIIYYIFGCSGSGKSHKCSEIAANYKKMYPERDIVLISPVNDNDKLKRLGVIALNCIDKEKAYRNFVDEETAVTAEDLRDTLVIIDDIEVLEGDKKLKPIKDGIDALLNKLLTFGRHQNTSIILSRHKPCDYRHTRGILSEAQYFSFFPNGQDRDIAYALDKYAGLTKEQIKRALKIKSRCVTMHRHRPRMIMGEHEAYVL